MTPRVLHWRSALLAWAEGLDGQPFAWGLTDCATLARKALEVCFGMDLVPECPSWNKPHEALRVIRDFGRPSQILTRLGAAPRPLTFVRAGDIIVMPEQQEPIGREALGVWLDGAVLLSDRERGAHIVARPIMPNDATAYSIWEVPARG